MLTRNFSLLVLSVLLIGLNPVPHAHAGTALAVIPENDNAYRVEDIQAMDLDDLLRVSDEFNAKLIKVRQITARDSNENLDLTPINLLGRYPLQESVSTLFAVIRSELYKADPKTKSVSADPKIFAAAIRSLSLIGTALPDNNILEMKDLIAEAKQRLGNSNLGVRLDVALRHMLEKMEVRSFALVDLNDLIEKRKRESEGSRDQLTRAQALLESRLIGQPEVAEALMDLEWRSELYGRARTVPDAIYLMGLPGTGKDTAAEALTDALHGYVGAYKEHLFRLPLMKTHADLWQVLGSATGYVGSENFPPFLAFLVQHSGGKYKIEREVTPQGKHMYRVVDNPDYHGETLPGYFAPQSGVVFVNEFHNWSKQLKDDFIKQALEKGYFTINNPNGGLSEIYVPIRFVIASNEGIRLIASREANGQRHGQTLDYERLAAKWTRVHDKKDVLKNEILATNGARNGATIGESTPGISEELLSRIPDRFILLMRPLSPEDLRRIADLGMNGMATRLAVSSNLLGKVQMSWSDELLRAIQEYDYVPEEGARAVQARIGLLVEDPLIDAIKERKIKPGSVGTTHLELDIATNPDNTKSLVIQVGQGSSRTTVTQLIRHTLKDRPQAPISDERIDQLAGIEEELKASVFGIDPILERLAQRIVSIENESAGKSDRPANLIMLTGLSSTGKTETAKQLSRHVNGSDDELVTFDFSQIQTLHDFQAKVLGLKDAAGNPIPSEFMKQYDRADGRLIVAFDELANVRDRDLLKSLYDFFREPVMRTFSDGKPRPMGGVTVIITGNAGQELYAQVPTGLPLEVQMEAWAEIYERTNVDYDLQRRILEKYYPEPLITRIGRNNIFFVPPHNYASLRQVAQLKLSLALDRLASTENRRGWEVLFPSVEEYKHFIDTIVDEGFNLRYQGASIDSFIRDDFEEPLKYLLLRFKVPSGSRVLLKYRSQSDNSDPEQPGYVYYDVQVEGRDRPIEYRIRRPHVSKPMEADKTAQIVTAYHEAGHSIVWQTAFKDAYIPTGVSIVPGVTVIGDRWVYYAGVAKADQEKELSTTRDWVVRQIAILAAGETAERLVSRGATHSTGKQNDMERATALARDAILRYGLSDKWGTQAIPAGTTTDAYVAGLSDKQKQLLEDEVRALIQEGRGLAERILEANFDSAFVPLALSLAENGKLDRKQLEAFYKDHPLTDPTDRSTVGRLFDRLTNQWRTRVRKWKSPRQSATQVELDASLPQPDHIADIQAMAEARKRALYDSVALPNRLPILSPSREGAAAAGSGTIALGCEALLQ